MLLPVIVVFAVAVEFVVGSGDVIGAGDVVGQVALAAKTGRPVGVGERGVIREAAQGPFGAGGAGELGEETLKRGVEKSARPRAREPHVASDLILAGRLRPVGTRRVRERHHRAGPHHALRGNGNGGEPNPGDQQHGEAKLHDA